MSARAVFAFAGLAVIIAAAFALMRQARASPAPLVVAPDPWANFYDDEPGFLLGPPAPAEAEEAPAGEYATESAEEEAGEVPLLDAFIPAAFGALGGLFMMGTKRSLSLAGLDALRRHEGFVATPYRDEAGHWTIGYGHKIGPLEHFSSVTEAQAMELLARDVNLAEDAVNGYVTVRLTQPQFDALVSFVYNVGAGAFRRSRLLKRLNAADYAAVPSEMARWRFVTRAGIKTESTGLIGRRSAEGALFASGSSGVYA